MKPFEPRNLADKDIRDISNEIDVSHRGLSSVAQLLRVGIQQRTMGVGRHKFGVIPVSSLIGNEDAFRLTIVNIKSRQCGMMS